MTIRLWLLQLDYSILLTAVYILHFCFQRMHFCATDDILTNAGKLMAVRVTFLLSLMVVVLCFFASLVVALSSLLLQRERSG